MEERYLGRWSVYIIADFCWMLKRDTILDGRKESVN